MIDPPSKALIGIGSNMPHADFASPRAVCEAAIQALEKRGLAVLRRSRWFKSAPVPASSQPWFINGVIAVETSLIAEELLSLMQAVEESFGRVRGEKNIARTLDLDLIAYDDAVIGWDEDDDNDLIVPHPRLSERAFVLLPLQEIVPDWIHPALQRALGEMIRDIDPGQQIMLDGEGG